MTILCVELAHAQQVSDDISSHVRRCYDAKVAKGIFPCARVPKIYRREWLDRSAKLYKIVPSEAFQPFQRAYAMMLAGTGKKAAWRAEGGKDVLGSYNAFVTLCGNPLIVGRYRGQDVNIPHAVTPEQFRAYERLSMRYKPVGKSKRQHDFFLRGPLVCPACGKQLTTSSPRGNGGKYDYYVCAAQNVRHVRIPRDQANEDALLLLQGVKMKASAAKRMGKEAVRRSEAQRAATEKRVGALRKELAEMEDVRRNSILLLAKGHITVQDKDMIREEYDRTKDKLTEAEAMLARHGMILENVLGAIQQIGLVLTEMPNRAMLTNFLTMAFPDGLAYDPKNRIFRTGGVNAALWLIPELTGASTENQVGPKVLTTNDPTMSGLRGQHRTAASDMRLFWDYVNAYKLAI